MVHFMDLATTELYKHTGDISISKLQGLLQIALKQSAAVNDSFADKIRCTLERYYGVREGFLHLCILISVFDYHSKKCSLTTGKLCFSSCKEYSLRAMKKAQ